jgi:hypothetical protein
MQPAKLKMLNHVGSRPSLRQTFARGWSNGQLQQIVSLLTSTTYNFDQVADVNHLSFDDRLVAQSEANRLSSKG